jgi:division protein CdvB (Snf7/Vps24/ESCRT-III family)
MLDRVRLPVKVSRNGSKPKEFATISEAQRHYKLEEHYSKLQTIRRRLKTGDSTVEKHKFDGATYEFTRA